MSWFNFLGKRSGKGEARESHLPHKGEQLSREDAEKMVMAFAKLLETDKGWIRSAARLPYPKSDLMRAFAQHEQHLCDEGNYLARVGWTEKQNALNKYLEYLRGARTFLTHYVIIDEKDTPSVDYFNSFSTTNDIPEERKDEFLELASKYLERGWQEEFGHAA
jgi:hypothetical protein